MEIRFAETHQDLVKAQSLLHEVYIEEQKWDPSPRHPNGFYIDKQDGKKVLKDCYGNSGHWTICLNKGDVVGVHRMLPQVQGFFEIEHYLDIPWYLKSTKTMEGNRLAIKRRFRRTRCLYYIFNNVCRFLVEHGYEYIFTTARHGSDLETILVNRFKMTKEGASFKYCLDDRHPVDLLVAPVKKSCYCSLLSPTQNSE